MKKIITALLLSLMIVPTNAMSEKIIFGTMKLPPFVYYENGNLTGSDIEIISEVCKHIDIVPEFHVVPFVRLLEDIKKGNVHANFPICYKKEREKYLYYPSESYNKRKMVILTRKDNNIIINGIADLKDKTIAVVSGYDYGPEFNNETGLKKEVCTNNEELLKLIVKGRRDFAATEGSVAIHTSKKLGFENKIKIIYTLIEDPLYVTFVKSSTGVRNKTLLKRFDKTLRTLKEKGAIEQILNKYQ